MLSSPAALPQAARAAGGRAGRSARRAAGQRAASGLGCRHPRAHPRPAPAGTAAPASSYRSPSRPPPARPGFCPPPPGSPPCARRLLTQGRVTSAAPLPPAATSTAPLRLTRPGPGGRRAQRGRCGAVAWPAARGNAAGAAGIGGIAQELPLTRGHEPGRDKRHLAQSTPAAAAQAQATFPTQAASPARRPVCSVQGGCRAGGPGCACLNGAMGSAARAGASAATAGVACRAVHAARRAATCSAVYCAAPPPPPPRCRF